MPALSCPKQGPEARHLKLLYCQLQFKDDLAQTNLAPATALMLAPGANLSTNAPAPGTQRFYPVWQAN